MALVMGKLVLFMIQKPTSVSPDPERETSRIHLGYLDGLRALAALFVVLHHCSLMVSWAGTPPRLQSALISLLFHGHDAVDLFIVLSGFCLMLPVARADGLLKGGPSAFFRRRVRRILPPYYLALGLSLALMWLFLKHPMGGFGDGSRQITWAGVGAHMFLIHDVFPATASQINPVFWSIAVEWRIYFAFPLLVWAWRRFGALATTLAALMIGYGLFAALASTPLNLAPWGMCPHYLGLFALGMLGAGITFSEAMVGLRQRVPWMVITLIGVPGLKLVPDQHWHGASLPFEVADGYVGLWAMCLLVAAGRGENNPLTNAPLATSGVSGDICLQHLLDARAFPAGCLAISPASVAPESHDNAIALMLIAAPVSVLLCYFFFLACERPFLVIRRREFWRKPPVTQLFLPPIKLYELIFFCCRFRACQSDGSHVIMLSAHSHGKTWQSSQQVSCLTIPDNNRGKDELPPFASTLHGTLPWNDGDGSHSGMT